MLGHAPSKKEIPTLKQNNYSSQFKLHKQQVENNDHSNITDHFNNNSNCYNDKFTFTGNAICNRRY